MSRARDTVGRVRACAHTGWVPLGILLVLAAAVRVFRIGVESYWFDELCSIVQARGSVAALIRDLAVHDVHPPLYPLLLWAWMRAAGDGETATRMLSAVAGTLAVLPMYALGRDLFDRWTAYTAAALLALNAFAVFYARETRAYSLLLLTGLTASWCLVQWVEHPESRVWRRSYVASAIALAYTHVFGLWLLAGHGLYVLTGAPALRRRFAHASLMVMIAFAPWLPVLVWQVWRVQRGFWIAPPSVESAAGWVWAWSGFNAWAAAGLVAAAVYGAAGLHRRSRLEPSSTARRTAGAFLACWLAGSLLLPLGISLVAQPILHAKAAVLVLGPFLLLAASGLRRLSAARSPVIAMLLLGVLTVDLPRQVHEARRKEQWRELAALARREAARGTLIVADAEIERYLTYYLGETPVTWLRTPEDVLGLEPRPGARAGDVLYLKIRARGEDRAAWMDRRLRRVAEERLVGAVAVRFQHPADESDRIM